MPCGHLLLEQEGPCPGDPRTPRGASGPGPLCSGTRYHLRVTCSTDRGFFLKASCINKLPNFTTSKIRNSKHAGSKQIKNPNLKCSKPLELEVYFDIRALNLFRISYFVLQTPTAKPGNLFLRGSERDSNETSPERKRGVFGQPALPAGRG